jgi:hypothetical protein
MPCFVVSLSVRLRLCLFALHGCSSVVARVSPLLSAAFTDAQALIDCFYILEDFVGLESLIGRITEGSPLLNRIGLHLQSVGLCVQAVEAFKKSGDVKAAIDCCVLLNYWDLAVSLAEAHEFPQVRRRAVLCCAVLCCAVLCCAVLCCAVLCCAVLCCTVLCCAVLCCAVLCCAVLCPLSIVSSYHVVER